MALALPKTTDSTPGCAKGIAEPAGFGPAYVPLRGRSRSKRTCEFMSTVLASQAGAQGQSQPGHRLIVLRSGGLAVLVETSSVHSRCCFGGTTFPPKIARIQRSTLGAFATAPPADGIQETLTSRMSRPMIGAFHVSLQLG